MTKLTKEELLKRAKDYAISRGGECLATEYVSAKTRLEWKCKNPDHPTWKIQTHIITKNSWCRKCTTENVAKKRKLSDGLEQAHKWALSNNGGKCLSTEYKNAATKMSWKCHNNNHPIFNTPLSEIKKGIWCKKCGDERIGLKNTLVNGLELAHQLALLNNGGRCLSTEYINSSTKMLWKCHNPKHPQWETPYQTIKKGSWCPQCSKLTEEEVLEKCYIKAKKEEGTFLSISYSHRNDKLRFKCEDETHPEFETTYDNVINHDTWCPECVGIEPSEKVIAKAKAFALTKGGECLSDTCVNKAEKLTWKCSNLHHTPWKSLYNNVVKRDRWCPICANYYNYKENKVREILNYLLSANFSKQKLDWNINPKTGKKLELDGYSEELKIGFEFQGLQHYQEVKYFKTEKENLEYIKYKDSVKKENCRKNNIKLIIIDDTIDTNTNIGLFNKVIAELKKLDIVIGKEVREEEVQEIFARMTDFQEIALEKANNYAISKKGRCLSTSYMNYHQNLEWKCGNDQHPSWFRTMEIIGAKSWCKQCYLEEKRPIK